MLINEVSKITALTKKAIEYYMEQGLTSPTVLSNGYRDFSESNVETLKKVSVLRKLGIGTEDAKAVLSDETGRALQKLSAQKELHMQQCQAKKVLLDKLSEGKSYAEIAAGIKLIGQRATITEKLLEAFPGHYGRFICLHFARFLNEAITTSEQQLAYQEIILFLDSVPQLTFPEELQEYLIEGTRHITVQNISDMLESLNQTYQNPDKFLSDNKAMLEDYLAFKQSDEFKSSPAARLMELMKAFNSTSGYYDVFIPAMKKISVAYSNYYAQMEVANEKLIAQYPDAAKLS